MLIEKINLDPNNPMVTLTTYVLDDSVELLNGKKRPAVLICPGGGYLYCSDREAEPVAMKFASMGYHAFVLRYHVYADSGNNFEQIVAAANFTLKEDCLYPAAIRDVAQAMTIIYDHANQWLVDTDKIALCGFSAGGHNVLNYAVKYNQPIISDHFDSRKIKPAAIIAGYPVVDYLYMKQLLENIPGADLNLFKLFNLAFLGEEIPSDQTLIEVSPNHHVSAATPPVFLWTTAEDRLVPAANSTLMATALANVGIPFELHVYESGPHGLSLATQATARVQAYIDPIASQWLPAVETWLEKRFALPMDEK